MSKKAFMKSVIDRGVSVKQRPGAGHYDMRNCLFIDEVAPYSIAKQIGLEQGDIFVEINGRPATKVDRWQWSLQSNEHRYVIYQPNKNRELRVSSYGIPLGVSTNKSNEAILHDYKRSSGDSEDLEILWSRYEWDVLAEVIALVKNGPQGLLQKLKSFLPLVNKEPDTVERLYEGVLLYQQGSHEAGMVLIDQFATESAHSYTMNYFALVMYYRALEFERLGDPETAMDILLESYDYSKLDPVKSAILQRGETPIVQDTPLLNQKFPVQYRLPEWPDKQNQTSLDEALSALDHGQLLVVCALGSYRSNGPYFEFMHHYVTMSKHFPNLFADLHVLSSATKPGRWDEAEDVAHEHKLRFTVLYDEDKRVQEVLDLKTAPYIFILDEHGVIKKLQRLYSELDYWELFGTL